MPPKPSSDLPATLRPFVAHGVDFGRTTGAEVEGECPFCGRRRLYVKTATGQWDCKVCAVTGNVYTFLTRVWEESFRRPCDMSWLVENRGIPESQLRALGVCKSVTTGEWLIPGYGASGTIVNLYRFRNLGERYAAIPTPSWEDGRAHHGWFGGGELGGDYDFVDVCEGVWDACAWRWVLSEADPERLEKTLVMATPGCNVWSDGWAKFCAGKIVTILYDNDHPRVNATSGVTTQPALGGVKRVGGSLLGGAERAKSVRYLCWGGEGSYEDASRADGFDVRDLVRESRGDFAGVVTYVDTRVRDVPPEWVSSPKIVTSSSSLTPLTCTSYVELIDAWKAADHYTPDFEGALVFALCVASSVEYGECQLWGKLIGAGSTGKSTICDGLGLDLEHVVTDSSVNDLYSGAIRNDGRDHSFAARLRSMCWINNDGDVLLRNPNREKVLSQMRELYGGKGSKAFSNGIGSRSYAGLRFTSLIAGTQGLKELDSADLGGRYLDYVFEPPSRELKRKIGLAAIRHQTAGTANGTGMTPEKERATRLTAGYLCHLRKTCIPVANSIHPTDAQAAKIYDLADYVAIMRSRPPTTQDEHDDNVEMPHRLCKQLSTVAVFSAVVRGRTAIDVSAMNLVRRVSLDTASGRTQNIVHSFARAGENGLDMPGLLASTRKDHEREHELVNYLSVPTIDVLEEFYDGVAFARRSRWRLSASFTNLYRSLFPTKIT